MPYQGPTPADPFGGWRLRHLRPDGRARATRGQPTAIAGLRSSCRQVASVAEEPVVEARVRKRRWQSGHPPSPSVAAASPSGRTRPPQNLPLRSRIGCDRTTSWKRRRCGGRGPPHTRSAAGWGSRRDRAGRRSEAIRKCGRPAEAGLVEPEIDALWTNALQSARSAFARI